MPALVGPTGHNLQRLAELVIVVLALLMLCQRKCRYRAVFLLSNVRPFYIWIAFSLFFVMMFSGAVADYGLRSLQDAGLYAGLLLLVIVFASVFLITPNHAIWIFCLLIAGVLSLRLLLMISVAISHPSIFDGNPMISGFSNIRSFNHVQGFLIPALLAGFFRFYEDKKRGLAILFFVMLTVQWGLLFYTKGRGILLALVLGFSIFLLFYGNWGHKLRQAVAGVSSLTIGFVFYWFVFVVWASLYGGEASGNYVDRLTLDDAGRFQLWGLALQSILKNPWLGVGGQGYFLLGASPPFGSAHNFILNFAVEYGVLAASLVVVLWVCFAKAFYRAGVKHNDLAIGWLALPLLIAIIYSFLTGMFLSPLSQLMTALFLGAFWAQWYRFYPSTSCVNRDRKLASAVRWLLLLTFLVSLPYVVLTASDVLLHRDKLTNCLGKEVCYPRFWLDGDYRRY